MAHGMRLTTLFILLATSLQADTACNFGTAHRTPPTNVVIQPHEEAFAEIIVENTLTRQHRRTCDLTLFGVTFTVEYSQARGTLPDDFTTTVPPGFRADPPVLTVDDFDSGSILIWFEQETTG